MVQPFALKLQGHCKRIADLMVEGIAGSGFEMEARALCPAVMKYSIQLHEFSDSLVLKFMASWSR